MARGKHTARKAPPKRTAGLSPKQRTFAEEYLIDLNATRAAIRAGYSAATADRQGSRLLKNVEVRAEVERLREARSMRAQINADRVLEELARIGFSDIRKVVKWYSHVAVAAIDQPDFSEEFEETGEIPDQRPVIMNQVELISSDDVDTDTAAAISEISMTDKGGLKVKFHDKQAALVNLGKHLGIFTDKIEVGGGAVTVEIVRFGASAAA